MALPSGIEQSAGTAPAPRSTRSSNPWLDVGRHVLAEWAGVHATVATETVPSTDANDDAFHFEKSKRTLSPSIVRVAGEITEVICSIDEMTAEEVTIMHIQPHAEIGSDPGRNLPTRILLIRDLSEFSFTPLYHQTTEDH